MLVLEKLRSVYENVQEQQMQQAQDIEQGDRAQPIAPAQPKELPPLQVVFGLDHLSELINAVLSPEERMGRLALSTQSRDEAERGQFFIIARKLASDMGCSVEVDDLPDEYTVWLYGSRRQIGALMRELAPRG